MQIQFFVLINIGYGAYIFFDKMAAFFKMAARRSYITQVYEDMPAMNIHVYYNFNLIYFAEIQIWINLI